MRCANGLAGLSGMSGLKEKEEKMHSAATTGAPFFLAHPDLYDSGISRFLAL
jgi:hypothetical protein